MLIYFFSSVGVVAAVVTVQVVWGHRDKIVFHDCKWRQESFLIEVSVIDQVTDVMVILLFINSLLEIQQLIILINVISHILIRIILVFVKNLLLNDQIGSFNLVLRDFISWIRVLIVHFQFFLIFLILIGRLQSLLIEDLMQGEFQIHTVIWVRKHGCNL